jgi:hypothetical protein
MTAIAIRAVFPVFGPTGQDRTPNIRKTARAIFDAMYGLRLIFRIRELGKSGFDLQNGAKIAASMMMVAAAFLDRTSLMAVGRRDLFLQPIVFGEYELTSPLSSSVPVYNKATTVWTFAVPSYALLLVSRLSFKVFVTALATILRRSPRLPVVRSCFVSVLLAGAWLAALNSVSDVSSFGLLSRSSDAYKITTLTERTDLRNVAWGYLLKSEGVALSIIALTKSVAVERPISIVVTEGASL